MADPIGGEFRMVTEGIRLGMTMEESLRRMAQRVPTLVYCFVLLVGGCLNVVVVRVATGKAMVDPGADPAMITYARLRSLSVVLGALTALVVTWFEPRYGQMSLVSIGLWRRVLTRRLH